MRFWTKRQGWLGVAALVWALAAWGCSDEAAAPGSEQAEAVEDAGGDEADSGVGAEEVGEEADAAEGPPQRELPPGPWEVTEPGHYGVGSMSERVTYTTQGGVERTLPVMIWYPSRDEGLERPDGVRPVARGNATFGVEGQAPVLLFSHGSGGVPNQSLFWTNHFASHGWIVIAPSHTGNDRPGEPIDVNFFIWRPEDVSAVLDAMQARPEGHLLHGRLSDDVVMSGHSFGGYTSLALAGAEVDVESLEANCAAYGVCAWLQGGNIARLEEGFHDPRIKASIPMTPAGSLIFGAGLGEMQVPVLLITAGQDQTLPDAQEGAPIWAQMDNTGDVRLHFPRAGHFSFADLCVTLPSYFLNDGCGPEFTDPVRVQWITTSYGLAFANLHALGDDRDAALLSGAESLGGGAEIEVK